MTPIQRFLGGATLLILGSLIAVESAQAKDLKDLLVEKGIITQAEADALEAEALATSQNGTEGSPGAPAKAVSTEGASSAPRITWKGGTRVEFPEAGATFGLNVFLQPRYTYATRDAAADSSSFDMNRARLVLAGSVLHDEFSFLLSEEFAGGEADLKDALVAWKPSPGLAFRFGQFDVSFG